MPRAGCLLSYTLLRANSPPMRFPVLPLCASPDGQPTAAEAKFLRSIQGGILKGHGRNHQRLVFFRFPRAETPEERRERAVQFLRHSGTRV